MNFPNKFCGAFFLTIALTLIGCVEFKKVTLYDGYEPVPTPAKPKDLALVVEPIIFDDDATDVWGLEANEDLCQEAELSEIAFSGKKSIKINWDRNAPGCKFAGIGIGWDGWAGKDLQPILDYAAIQFYVRTIEGRAFALPMVFTLIDYSDGMGFSYTANKYFERTAIDEEWQRVVVPLNSFEMEKENLNPSNIKQLQIELQQSGSFYIDDIKLVFYEEQPQEPWMVEEVLPSPIRTPIQIFDDVFINDNGWGMVTNDCKDIKISGKDSAEGDKSLYIKWSDERGNCRLTALGASWHKWKPVDITPIREKAAFEFKLKMVKGSAAALPIQIGFEDYERAKSFVALKPEFVNGGTYDTSWKTVRVPLSEIPQANLDLTRIKQLYINLQGRGEVFLDDIKLVN